MGICDKCLENRWTLRHSKGWTLAICDICDNSIEFHSGRNEIGKKKIRKISQKIPRAFIGFTKKDKYKYMIDMKRANRNASEIQRRETESNRRRMEIKKRMKH